MSHSFGILNILFKRGNVSDIHDDSGKRYIYMSERRGVSVTGTRSTSGIHDVQTVFGFHKAFVRVTVENYITVMFSGGGFDWFERTFHAVKMTVSSKDFAVCRRKYKLVMAHAVVVAVSGNVYNLAFKCRIGHYKAVEFTFAVAEMYEPVSVCIAQ